MLVRDIEKALNAAEQTGVVFGSKALSKGALVHLCRRLDHNRTWRILELGGGLTPHFWNEIVTQELLPISLITVEHDLTLSNTWKEAELGNGCIEFHTQPLKNLTDEEWNEIFSCPDIALSVWNSYGLPVPTDQHNHYTIRNTFYADVDMLPLEDDSIDVMILDGPHGNGRSLAYPLFYKKLKPDAFVLVDDYDHYPFMDDLRRFFQVEEISREGKGDYRWQLCRLAGRCPQPDPVSGPSIESQLV